MFSVDWELEGQKKLKGRDFFEENLVRLGLQETNNFLRPLSQLDYYKTR